MDEVFLERYLKVGLPENADVTYQIIPEFSEDQEVVCGWENDELSYILSADDQPGGYEHSHYWNSMEQALKNSADRNTFKILKVGNYLSDNGIDISYRIYKRSSLGDEELHIYHLISNDVIAYWVLATLVNIIDIFKVNNEIIQIMKTAKLVN